MKVKHEINHHSNNTMRPCPLSQTHSHMYTHCIHTCPHIAYTYVHTCIHTHVYHMIDVVLTSKYCLMHSSLDKTTFPLVIASCLTIATTWSGSNTMPPLRLAVLSLALLDSVGEYFWHLLCIATEIGKVLYCSKVDFSWQRLAPNETSIDSIVPAYTVISNCNITLLETL